MRTRDDDVEILEEDTPYRGYFRIDRFRLRVRTHDGSWSQPMVREVFERGHAVAVLLYDPDADMVGLIEQFRPGALAAGMEPWLTEVVAGMIDEGETPEEVAIRETREETGATVAASDLIFVNRFLMSPGGTSETIRLFCARVDAGALSGFHGLAEENEDIRVFAIPAAQAFEWLNEGRVVNAMSIIALQWLALNREGLRSRWSRR